MIADAGQTDSSGWKRRAAEDTPDGTIEFSLTSWSRFFDFLDAEVFNPSIESKRNYIWRGQSNSEWSLNSSADRLFQQLNLLTASQDALEERLQEHLKSFKRAARGRRGLNPAILSENDWWALGQHFGLATPLLDWTRSPFAAAYFAFEEPSSGANQYRAVYALDQSALERRGRVLSEGVSLEQGRPPIIEFPDPMSDENQRLVSQSGLFTRAPLGTPIEKWVAWAFEGSSEAVLLKIRIPDSDRAMCLRALNRMNINHLSLFPDLTGASRSTNLKLELDL